MVFCVQAELAFGTARTRDQVVAFLQQKIDAAPKWDGTVLTAGPVDAGANGLRLEVRFMSRAPQLDVVMGTPAFTVGARAPRPGSVLRWHDCLHDEGGLCSGVTTREW